MTISLILTQLNDLLNKMKQSFRCLYSVPSGNSVTLKEKICNFKENYASIFLCITKTQKKNIQMT